MNCKRKFSSPFWILGSEGSEEHSDVLAFSIKLEKTTVLSKNWVINMGLPYKLKLDSYKVINSNGALI